MLRSCPYRLMQPRSKERYIPHQAVLLSIWKSLESNLLQLEFLMGLSSVQVLLSHLPFFSPGFRIIFLRRVEFGAKTPLHLTRWDFGRGMMAQSPNTLTSAKKRELLMKSFLGIHPNNQPNGVVRTPFDIFEIFEILFLFCSCL